MKAFLPLLSLVLLVCASARGQEVIRNSDFLFEGDTLLGWRPSYYATNKGIADWKETGQLKLEWKDDALLLEQNEVDGVVTLFQSAANFQQGAKYRISLTYDDSAFDGKIIVMIDGGSSGIQGLPSVEFPHSDKPGEFVTNSMEFPIPTDGDMANTSFQIRVIGVGPVKIKRITIEPI